MINHSPLLNILFPDLVSGKWEDIDLNDRAASTYGCPKDDVDCPNPLLDPVFCQKWIDELHESMQCNYSYGGYMEDRKDLWRGHYHKYGETIHLGLDFNVPAETRVFNPFNGRCVHAIHDKDRIGGWGGRVVLHNEQGKFYYILGHLDQTAELFEPGVWHGKGCLMGWVGQSENNGGWHPHLHLQCISEEEYEKHPNPISIDGYGADCNTLRRKYPNPLGKFRKQ